MYINGINYQIIGKVRSKKIGQDVPVLDIPMRSDEKWKELTSSSEQIERRKLRSMQKDGVNHG